MEIGSLPVLTQHVIHNTKRIKVGPIGYVLPGWNPLRLALEIAWLDQLGGEVQPLLELGHRSRHVAGLLVPVGFIRRHVRALEPQQALEVLMERMKETKSNAEFLLHVQKTTVAS